MNVTEAAANLKAARTVARARLKAEIEARLNEEVREETAQLAVAMHAAFNSGQTKESLRRESGLYNTPLFDEVWNAVPYAGRDVKPGRVGAYATGKPQFEGRYQFAKVPVETGYGLMILSRDGEPMPEVLTLPLRYYEDRERWGVEDLAEMPDWWFDMMRGGEYRILQEEVDKFAKHEGVRI